MNQSALPPAFTGNTFEIQARLACCASNYNRWIYRAIADGLGRRVLDVGCASGNITRHIVEGRDLVVGVDIEQGYVDAITHALGDRPGFRAIRMDFLRDDLALLREIRFDSITCINVLEHLPDDMEVLARFRDLLPSAGTVHLVVPAFMALYGTMDRADDHYRRYTRGDLLARLARAGFDPVSAHYMNLPGFFAWWWNGRILRRTIIPDGPLGWFDAVVPVIAAIERLISPPFGQSLVAVARRSS